MLLRVVDEVAALQEVLQDAVGVGVVLDVLVNEEGCRCHAGCS